MHSPYCKRIRIRLHFRSSVVSVLAFILTVPLALGDSLVPNGNPTRDGLLNSGPGSATDKAEGLRVSLISNPAEFLANQKERTLT